MIYKGTINLFGNTHEEVIKDVNDVNKFIKDKSKTFDSEIKRHNKNMSVSFVRCDDFCNNYFAIYTAENYSLGCGFPEHITFFIDKPKR